ncbi:MAG: hypothetical protein WCF67_08010, partial [Chitinophagaceae bacterium]
VNTTHDGKIIDGRIVQLVGKVTRDEKQKRYVYNGFVTTYTLDRRKQLQATIRDGRMVIAPVQASNQRTATQSLPQVLPTVVVVGYLVNNNISLSTWISLMNLFDGNTYWQYSNYYSLLASDESGSVGNQTGGSSMVVDYENQDEDAPIDLQRYIECFNAIPDDGANCSITIFSDLPVDNDPNKLFSFQNGSPGHTFLQIKKANGTQMAQQSIGFYPKSGWKTTLTTAPIESKFVDNGGHEFNASYRMNLNATQLKTVLHQMVYFQNMRYDIDEFNCTDYALTILNSVRDHPFEIPRYDIPGGMTSSGTNTPQGLYHQLKAIKDGGGPEAANVTIGFLQAWVGGSKGPCN